MLKVFVSSTFRDLEEDRKRLRDKLKTALVDIGMEDFVPDGKTSQEIGIEELRKSDLVIFLISPYYGSLLKECNVKDCKAECSMKKGRDKISYTHCEYKIALAENKPYLPYLISEGWNAINLLKDWKKIDWREIRENDVFNGFSNDEIEDHYYRIAKKAWEFKNEVESVAFCPRIGDINDIEAITFHLANNIIKWYSEGKINLEDFCGRKKQLMELFEKMTGSVEVYGVGGIGKTTLVHAALIIQKLRGKKIVTVGAKQSYITDSGYKYFIERFNKEHHEIIGNKITLDDILIALSVPNEIRIKRDITEKLSILLDRIEKEDIILFIDDFHLADEDVKKLVKHTDSNLVLASKRKVGIARNELHLTGIDLEERGELIELIANRLGKEISSVAKDRIKEIAEGHPVSTEILLRNYELLNFQELKKYKQGLDLSNPEHFDEFLERVVEEILSKEALSLLKNLSIINAELDSNIDIEAIKQTYPPDFKIFFRELIDTGFLEKKKGMERVYQFSYLHIQDAIKDNEKERHRKAIEYYNPSLTNIKQKNCHNRHPPDQSTSKKPQYL